MHFMKSCLCPNIEQSVNSALSQYIYFLFIFHSGFIYFFRKIRSRAALLSTATGWNRRQYCLQTPEPEAETMPFDTTTTVTTMDFDSLLRPALLARAARRGAAMYRRGRDLPGAVAGLSALPREQIVPRLAEAEALCETARRARAPGYRPARHVQILSALLAETAAAAGRQPKASGSDALRPSMNARSASATAGSSDGAS
jgi:hypothetical protein